MLNYYQYEVALSFAGQQRSYVEEVVIALQTRGIKVFYDESERIRLWGSTLIEELPDVYANRANYTVMFISKEYIENVWPNVERLAILERHARQKGGYILPVRFDDTEVPGLPTSIGYECGNSTTPYELATMIAERLGISRYDGKASDVPSPRMTSMTGEAVFDYSNHSGKYTIGHDKMMFETQWSKGSERAIYVYNDPNSIYGVALAYEKTRIAEISKAEALDFTSRSRKPMKNEIVVLQNIRGFYAAILVIDIKDRRKHTNDQLRFKYVIQPDGSGDFSQFSDV